MKGVLSFCTPITSSAITEPVLGPSGLSLPAPDASASGAGRERPDGPRTGSVIAEEVIGVQKLKTPFMVDAVYLILLGLVTLSPGLVRSIFGYDVKDTGV